MPPPATPAPILNAPAVPLGWYDDPYVAHQVRWWDGSAWTDHVSPLPTSPDKPASVLRTPLTQLASRSGIKRNLSAGEILIGLGAFALFAAALAFLRYVWGSLEATGQVAVLAFLVLLQAFASLLTTSRLRFLGESLAVSASSTFLFSAFWAAERLNVPDLTVAAVCYGFAALQLFAELLLSRRHAARAWFWVGLASTIPAVAYLRGYPAAAFGLFLVLVFAFYAAASEARRRFEFASLSHWVYATWFALVYLARPHVPVDDYALYVLFLLLVGCSAPAWRFSVAHGPHLLRRFVILTSSGIFMFCALAASLEALGEGSESFESTLVVLAVSLFAGGMIFTSPLEWRSSAHKNWFTTYLYVWVPVAGVLQFVGINYISLLDGPGILFAAGTAVWVRAWVARNRNIALVAASLVALGWWWQVDEWLTGEYPVEAVSVPAGALLILAVAAVMGRGPERATLPLLPGLLVALLPSATLGLESAEVWRFSATVAACVLMLMLAVASRLRAPMLAAAPTLAVLLLVRALVIVDSTWVALTLAAVVLLGLGVFLERRRPKMSDLRAFVESYR